MCKIVFILIIITLVTSCSHTYYIVRHAEKAVPSAGATMNTTDDPFLCDAGEKRAQALKQILMDKNISHVFSTNTNRARLTAEPLSKESRLTIQTYGPRPDSAFIKQLKGIKGNVLIVGHSNTVDEIVNGLTGDQKLSDLTDSEYDNLFVVRYKTFFGKKVSYRREKY